MNVAEIDPLTLPSLPLGERSQLPNCPAIYFVLTGDCVVYIGRTVNLKNRWTSHRVMSFVQKQDNARLAWLECNDASLLPEIETALLNHFQPSLNVRNIGTGAKKDDPDYVAIRGHIPKELYKRFKVFCLEGEMDNSQGLENLLREYFEVKDKSESSSPASNKKKNKGAA